MSTAQSFIEDAVIDILAQTGPCTIDEVAQSLPAHDWSEVFFAVDNMSRDGRLVFRRPSSSVYQLSLSESSQGNRTERTTSTQVRFCLGCGYLCDKVTPESGPSPWVEANRYLKKHGLTWFELERIDSMCPACSHVQACGTRRGSPRTAAQSAR
ncbi:MAG: hypothetical protein KF876_14920 [Nitrospira sp.]|nr:hypothetical protein [Nitrospira sp.]MDR4462977.1 hypothetical protein [Nitrospira sp.]